MSLQLQFLTLFSMIGCGAIIGTLLDIYRVSSIELKWKRWMKSTLDLFFWVVAAFIVIFTLQRVNNGFLHVYVFAAIGVGYLSYAIWIRSFVMKRVRNFIVFMRKLIQFVKQIIQMIVIKPILFLYKIGYALLIGFFLILYRILLVIFFPFQKFGKWLLQWFKTKVKNIWDKFKKKRD